MQHSLIQRKNDLILRDLLGKASVSSGLPQNLWMKENKIKLVSWSISPRGWKILSYDDLFSSKNKCMINKVILTWSLGRSQKSQEGLDDTVSMDILRDARECGKTCLCPLKGESGWLSISSSFCSTSWFWVRDLVRKVLLPSRVLSF